MSQRCQLERRVQNGIGSKIQKGAVLEEDLRWKKMSLLRKEGTQVKLQAYKAVCRSKYNYKHKKQFVEV